MEGKNDSLAAHLIFRARGSDEHFLLTRTQLHTGEGEGGHPRYLSSAQKTFGLALISGVQGDH